MQIKILVVIALICGVFASGYFVGRYVIEREAAKSVTSQRDGNRKKFTEELIQFRAKTRSSNLTSEDMHQITTQFRIASDTYVLNAKHLKATGPIADSERECLSDAADLMDSLAVFRELCQYDQPECKGEMIKAQLETFASVNGKLTECLEMFTR
jgi:hypothetical protein